MPLHPDAPASKTHPSGPAERRQPRSDVITPHPIVILLASYQGAAFIEAQLNSIADQTHGDWSLLVSDDGSRDETRTIVDQFAASQGAGKVRLIDGPRAGATRNFLHLIQQAPPDHPIAFCDQDDVWFPDKIARALDAMTGTKGAAHYAARTVITDPQLQPVTESRRFKRPFGFRNALVQACMAGNTSVFNAEAAALLKAGAESAEAACIESHDWWAYQLTSGAGARLIHDADPALFYRQHPRSEMGRNDTAGAMAKRLGKLFAGNYGDWLHANLAALMPMRDRLTPENRQILDGFAGALEKSGPQTARIMRRLGLYRHTTTGTAALYTAASLGKLAQPRSANSLIK